MNSKNAHRSPPNSKVVYPVDDDVVDLIAARVRRILANAKEDGTIDRMPTIPDLIVSLYKAASQTNKKHVQAYVVNEGVIDIYKERIDVSIPKEIEI